MSDWNELYSFDHQGESELRVTVCRGCGQGGLIVRAIGNITEEDGSPHQCRRDKAPTSTEQHLWRMNNPR